MLETAELAPGALVEVGDIGWQRILHGAFDAGIAGFLGIKVWGIGRQIGHGKVLRVGGEEGGGSAGAVRIEPIPDDQKGAADLAPKVPPSVDDKLAGDATAEMAGIQSPCGRDGDDAGDLASLAQPLQHWGHPAPRPGGARPGAEAMTGLVEEEDGAPFAAGLLF
jgi:hypothetical protein